jgi:hypothetical protein
MCVALLQFIKLAQFQFIICLTFFTKFDRLVLFKKNRKNKKLKVILKVYYVPNNITLKINNNCDFFNKTSQSNLG